VAPLRFTSRALVVILFAACGASGRGVSDGGATDMAAGAAVGSDMHKGSGNGDGGALDGCRTLAICEYNCNAASCDQGCLSNATAMASTLYDALDQCATNWCVNMTHHCVLDANMNPVDPTGAAMGTCDDCLNDAVAMTTPPPSMCNNPGGSDCNPTACLSAQQACLADKP
jgi:hypothetical protein